MKFFKYIGIISLLFLIIADIFLLSNEKSQIWVLFIYFSIIGIPLSILFIVLSNQLEKNDIEISELKDKIRKIESEQNRIEIFSKNDFQLIKNHELNDLNIGMIRIKNGQFIFGKYSINIKNISDVCLEQRKLKISAFENSLYFSYGTEEKAKEIIEKIGVKVLK